jgi:hypothetical protein
MAHYTRPHSYISGARALTGTSVHELIRPNLRLSFPLRSKDDPNEDRFRRLLDALAQCRSGPLLQSA